MIGSPSKDGELPVPPPCRLNRKKSEVCFDRLVSAMERCRQTAPNWSGLPEAGRLYIRTGRIIGLMGHSCVWTQLSRPRWREKKVFNICSPLNTYRRKRRTEAEMFFRTSLIEEELRSSPGTLGKPACGAAGGRAGTGNQRWT